MKRLKAVAACLVCLVWLGGCSPQSSCLYTNDGECDDGRPGAPFALCAPGTDEADCAGLEAASPE